MGVLFLALEPHPVGRAREIFLLAPGRHRQVRERGAEFRADLLVDGIEDDTGHVFDSTALDIVRLESNMRRHLLIAAAVLATAQSAGARQARPVPTYTDAYEAWDRGDYVTALERLKTLVPGSDERTFEAIALLTGELYQTREVTADGRNPQISADGTLITYEIGPLNQPPVVRAVRTQPGFPLVAEFAGSGAVISPEGGRIAYA